MKLTAIKLPMDDVQRIFGWLNEADAKADELYEAAKKAGAKSFAIQHPAHRIAGALGALRHTIETAAGMDLNASRKVEK